MSKLIDLTGQRFGRRTVKSRGANGNAGQVRWECECDCGNRRLVFSAVLRYGRQVSCGCWKDALVSARRLKHGMSESVEYNTWLSIKNRCKTKSNKKYHGRGIKVCARWLESFENFYTDMGERPSVKHSIERIENDGDYSSENCYWATLCAQSRNTRQNNNLTNPRTGVTMCITDFSKSLGGTAGGLIRKRLARGWSLDRALNEPVMRR